MRVAFQALSAGQAQSPQRGNVTLAEQGVALLMPSLLQTTTPAAFGLKICHGHTARPLREVRVVNRSDEHYQCLVETLQALLGASCPPRCMSMAGRSNVASV